MQSKIHEAFIAGCSQSGGFIINGTKTLCEFRKGEHRILADFNPTFDKIMVSHQKGADTSTLKRIAEINYPKDIIFRETEEERYMRIIGKDGNIDIFSKGEMLLKLKSRSNDLETAIIMKKVEL